MAELCGKCLCSGLMYDVGAGSTTIKGWGHGKKGRGEEVESCSRQNIFFSLVTLTKTKSKTILRLKNCCELSTCVALHLLQFNTPQKKTPQHAKLILLSFLKESHQTTLFH